MRNAVSNMRHLNPGKEKKVRVRGGELVFYRQEIDVEKVGGVTKTPLNRHLQGVLNLDFFPLLFR